MKSTNSDGRWVWVRDMGNSYLRRSHWVSTSEEVFLGETGEDSHIHLLSPVTSECINMSWTWTQAELPKAGRICTFTSSCLMRELEPETLTIHTPLCFLTSAWQFPLSAGHLLLPKLANSPPAF